MGGMYLKHNANTTVPANHLVVDTETRMGLEGAPGEKQVQPLRCWVATAFRYYDGKINREVWKSGTEREPFWLFLTSRLDRYRPLWVWMHNVGFDCTSLGLWAVWDRGVVDLLEPAWRAAQRKAENPRTRQRRGFVADSDPPSILHLWHATGCQVRIVDTMNWYRDKLAALGELHGLPKLPMPHPDDPDRAWLQYCTRDVEITRAVVVGLLSTIQRHDMGVMQATGAGQAMQCYRHRFMKHKLLIHDNAQAKALERQAYHGGRCEPLYLGTVQANPPGHRYMSREADGIHYRYIDGPIVHLDVSSLYPSVMRGNLFPARLREWHPAGVGFGELSSYVLSTAVADVSLDSPEQVYPVVVDKETLYCRGRIRTQLAGPELVRAWVAGHIKAVHAMATFEMAEIFTEYVDYWWSRRRQAEAQKDVAEAGLCKLLLNSLYGKFGQTLKRWEIKPGVRPHQRWGVYADRDPETGTPRLCRGVAGVLQIRNDEPDARHAMPAIAAFVTAYGRLWMDKMRAIAGRDHVYYQGVDSLYVDMHGYEQLCDQGMVQERQLGLLRQVEAASSMSIYGVNDYVFGDKVARSGFTRPHIHVPSGEEVQDRFQGLKGILQSGPSADVIHWTEPIAPRQPYSRGIVDESGWITPLGRTDW